LTLKYRGIKKLVASKKRSHVLALELDRLFRDAADALNQTKAWDKGGLALHLVDLGDQTLNTASAMGRFFLNVMAGFAELKRNLIAERTGTAMKHKKAHREAYPLPPLVKTRRGYPDREPPGAANCGSHTGVAEGRVELGTDCPGADSAGYPHKTG
jgi:DNA invertase Pin-like site-specific DNA recombinase